MERKLNELLADLALESHKLQRMHWYVKGPDFFQAHLQLENYYNEVSGLVDDVAEVMLMCGMKPIATVREFLDASGIEEHPGEFITSAEAFAEIARDFEHILNTVKDIKKRAGESGCDIVGIKADALVESFSKAAWMLNQH